MRLFYTLFRVFVFLFIQLNQLFSDVRLPAVIGDNMVLQQHRPLQIWGWADPGESVIVQIENNRAKAKADKQGKWKLTLVEMKAGGPYIMTVKGKNSITLQNILIGEVWICSGQSNMAWRMRSVENNIKEILSANYAHIRLFHVPRRASGHPKENVDAEWKECDPTTVINFSAVSYFFGRMLHKKLNVPVGLIHTSWGGTRIEPWTAPVGFKLVPELKEIVEEIETSEAKYREDLGNSLNEIELWLTDAKNAYAQKKEIPSIPTLAKFPLEDRQKPTALYNGQVHPLVPFAIRGAIWYQGEANRNDGPIYFEKMKALITSWRKVWGLGDFPFYYVQLAPFSYAFRDPGEANALRLPIIREAQRKALSIPNTGMVVTTDIGNLYDIHPMNKQEVGRRLALWALAKTYGKKNIVYSGPLYKSMRIWEGKIRIQLDHAESGLASRDGKPLDWFEIAGPDKKFVRAQAIIKGNEVVVWNSEVDNPVAVRFGWHEEAVPNLINKKGLPASPFDTETK